MTFCNLNGMTLIEAPQSVMAFLNPLLPIV
jgi:hypothetical protein